MVMKVRKYNASVFFAILLFADVFVDMLYYHHYPGYYFFGFMMSSSLMYAIGLKRSRDGLYESFVMAFTRGSSLTKESLRWQ